MRSCSRLRESQSVFLSLFFRSILYERLLSKDILLLPPPPSFFHPSRQWIRSLESWSLDGSTIRENYHGQCATDIPAGKSTKCFMIDYQTQTWLRWTLRSHYNLSDRHCGCHWIVTFCKLNLLICICQSIRK